MDGLIAACETYFGQPPKKFDIGGPYGIRKGQPVGIRSFRNRLAKWGHEDYYALWAREEDSFGFDCSFGRLTSTEYTFSELLFWYETKKHDARILDIATDLIKVFPVDYGLSLISLTTTVFRGNPQSRRPGRAGPPSQTSSSICGSTISPAFLTATCVSSTRIIF